MQEDAKPQKELLSVEEFLSIYPISRSTFNTEVKKKRLTVRKNGSRVFVLIEEARRWAHALEVGNP